MNTEYQEFVKTTDLSNGNPIFYIFGMLEETGELAGICKRSLRGDYGNVVQKLANAGAWDQVFKDDKVLSDVVKEKGDDHWYGSNFLSSIGVTWATVENINMAKLKRRQETNTIIGSGDTRENG
jgi:hypothetical protein